MSLGRVDRYELLQLIGQGTFGGVYRARHVHTGQIHALKLAQNAIDPEGTARVLAEARAAASLRHPNVVGVIDGGVSATGEAFIVMELLDGATLSQVIAGEGPLPPARATRIARQMLDGLAAAHANGIIHRDVKPSNVFITMASELTGGDMVKVIDFGISKMRAGTDSEVGMTLPGIAMGTPGYMAPEQCGDARSVDPRADVYAVGATLFEMLTKRCPIEVDSLESWMQRVRTERPPALATVAPHVPPGLADVVDRALARDPDARWPSAVAMRDALDAALTLPFSQTAMDTPRAVVQGSPYTSSWPAQVSPTAPPIPSPSLPLPMTLPMAQSFPPHATMRSGGGSSAVFWIVGGLIAAIGLVGVVGAGVFFYVMRGGAASTVAAPAATVTAPAAAAPPAIATVSAARPVGGGPLPAAPSAKPAPEPAAPAAPAKAGGVRISSPKIIGELRQDAFMALAARARPAIEQCNPDHRVLVVKVDVMIANKKITIAEPSVNTNPGDPVIARCVANSLKDAQSAAFAPGNSGIYQEAQFSWQ